MSKKFGWSLIIFVMIFAFATVGFAAPKPNNAGSSGKLKALTASGWSYAAAHNLVYWNVDNTSLHASGDKAWKTGSTDDSLVQIPSRYTWSYTPGVAYNDYKEYVTSVSRKIRTTANHMNSLGDGMYVIGQNASAIPVAKVDLAHSTDGVHLYGMTITIFGNSNFNPYEDLMPIDSTSMSGLQIWQENSVGIDGSPETFDSLDIRMQFVMDSMHTHFSNAAASFPALASQPTGGSTAPDPNTHGQTWMPCGYVDTWLQEEGGIDDEWFAWQVYVEFPQPIAIDRANTSAGVVPFQRFWIALRPAACCDNPEGPIDADTGAYESGNDGSIQGDEFMVALVQDLVGANDLTNATPTEYSPYRILDHNSYDATAAAHATGTPPAATDWEFGLVGITRSMLLRPRYLDGSYSKNGNVAYGSEASWSGASGANDEPALWDVPGIIHGWTASYGPVAGVLEPLVTKSFVTGDRSDNTVPSKDSLAYYNVQQNHSLGYPYTSDSLQPVVFVIRDLDNCIEWDSVYLEVDTSGDGNTDFYVGIDSIRLWNNGTFVEMQPYNNSGIRDAINYSGTNEHPYANDATHGKHDGLVLCVDTAGSCEDTLLFFVNKTGFGKWKDGQIVTVTLRARDTGNNQLFLNYNGPNPSYSNDPEASWIETGALKVRFAVDLSAPIAKMICPEYVDRPTNNANPIRVARGTENTLNIKIHIKDAFLADSSADGTRFANLNGEDHVSGAGDHPLYVHDGGQHAPTYANLSYTVAPGTGFDPTNFAIVITQWQCGSNAFNPGNYSWGAQNTDNANGEKAWTGKNTQWVITNTSDSYVSYEQDADHPQNGILTIDLKSLTGITVSDGDVYLVEIVDAATLVNTISGYGYSDGLHDSPHIIWSDYRFGDNATSGDATYGIAQTTDQFASATNEDYHHTNNGSRNITSRFDFVNGDISTLSNYAFAWANPNKHFSRDDETDSDNSGVHSAPDYDIAGGDYYATDTLGWFYIDQKGPIVDVDAVYPQMRRGNEVYDNSENLYSYTSDPYQVITIDLADLSCTNYADSFAAGMDVNSIVLNIKVTSVDGNYHPYFGPNGKDFTVANGGIVAANQGTADVPCFYIDDPTDTHQDVIDGVTGTSSTLSSIDPATRLIFDPRLGPKDTQNLLGFGSDEPAYRFRDGDKVCVTVYARDVATGGCEETLGNEIENDDYAENGATLQDSNLFKYQFMVDTKEPELGITLSDNGCNNVKADINIEDFVRDAATTNACSTCVAGADSVFVQVTHWDYDESAGDLVSTPTIYRFAIGPEDVATYTSSFYNVNGGEIIYKVSNTEGRHNFYNNGPASSRNKYSAYTVEVSFDCPSFNDGDSVEFKVWGKDAIDVPWYPLTSSTNNWDVFDYHQLTSIDHQSQSYGSSDYNFRKDFEHPNMDVDSNATVDSSATTNIKYFHEYSASDFWWTSWDWRTADSDSTSSTANDDKYAFEYIHWYNQCPWYYDNISRAEGYGDQTTLPHNATDNNAWDSDGDASAVDDDTDWTNGNHYDQHDDDWTDLDTIQIANNVHHNWAKPVSTGYRFSSGAKIATVKDYDNSSVVGETEWTWPYGNTNTEPVVASPSAESDIDIIANYRTSLKDSLVVAFSSCDQFYYCNGAADTTVGFAMEVYDKDGNIKWYWPFKMDDNRYNNGHTFTGWETAFADDKAAVGSNDPVQYGWWDCDCPGCNGILWYDVNEQSGSGCKSYTAKLKVDFNKLETYDVNGNYFQIGPSAFADGDSVVVYTFTRTQGTDDQYTGDDHIVKNSWYYLIDQKAPTFEITDLEIYVPENAGDTTTAFVAKGDFNNKLEARYNDVVRVKVSHAMDDTTSRKSNGGEYEQRSVGISGDLVNYLAINASNEISVGNPNPSDAISTYDDIIAQHVYQVEGTDTTYYAAVKINDGYTNLREYKVTITMTLKDNLGNSSNQQTTVVVDNNKPGLMWNYCENKLNAFPYDENHDGTIGDDEYFLGYWLNREEGTSYITDVDDVVDTNGITLYQDAQNPTAKWNEISDDVIEMVGHVAGQNRSEKIELCNGQLYILINFNDLMYTGTEHGQIFSSTGQVFIKPQNGSARPVQAVSSEDIYRIVEKLQYFANNPTLAAAAKKHNVKANEDTKDGWVDENTWLGQVYIGANSEWDGDATIGVIGFYDKAGNKMGADTACFQVSFTTTDGVVGLVSPKEGDSTAAPFEYLKATVQNLTSINTLQWYYAIEKATYSDSTAYDEVIVNTISNVDSFSTTTKPAANTDAPYLTTHGSDIETTYVYFDAAAADPTNFATRKDVKFRVVIKGASACVDSMTEEVGNIEVDYEAPQVEVDCDNITRDASANYERVLLAGSYFDDVSYYDITDEAQAALAKSEISSVEWQVWDVTPDPATENWVAIPASAVLTLEGEEVTAITPENANNLIFIPDSMGINKYDSLQLRLVAVDNLGNADTSGVCAVEQIVKLPMMLARGNDRDNALESVGFGGGLTTRSFWPPYFKLDNPMSYDVDGKIYIVDSVQVTTFTHYNLSDQNPDVNDPFGRNFTAGIREYPGDSVYVVAYNLGTLVDDADSVYFLIEGANAANGVFEPSNALFANGENKEQYLAAEKLTLGTDEIWVAKWFIEDENARQDGIVRVKIIVKRDDGAGHYVENTKLVDYQWFALDTEDPDYIVTYTDAAGNTLPTAKVASDVVNTEDTGNGTVQKTLVAKGGDVYVTNAQKIKALINVDQTVFNTDNQGSVAKLSGKARLWAHINVDFEAPTENNSRTSDEVFAKYYIDNNIPQTYKAVGNWLDKETEKTYVFETEIKDGSNNTSGFAWLKIEARDAAGNYTRDWSTDECEGLVVYIDTKAPSAPDASKLGAIPVTSGGSTAAANTGLGSDRNKVKAMADGESYKIFGFAGAAIDDSWPTELVAEGNLPTVKVVDKDGNVLGTTTPKTNGSFTVVVNELPEDSVFYVKVVDLAGNESAATAVKLQQPVTVSVSLTQGWNLFSVNVKGGKLESVLGESVNSTVLNNLQYVYTVLRDGKSALYSKEELETIIANGDTTEVELNSDDVLAYWINVLQPCNLTVTGIPIDPETEITLSSGWNFVGYLPENNAKISEAIASGLDNVEAIAYDGGRTEVVNGTPSNDFMMYTGKGYLFKVAEGATATIVYNPDAGAGSKLAKAQPPVDDPEVSKSRVFQFYTGKITFEGKPAVEGDVVKVYDENGVLCGKGTVEKDGSYSIVVYGDDKLTKEDEGATANGKLIFKINDQYETVADNSVFAGDYRLEKLNLDVRKPLPKTYSLSQNVPNPFNPTTAIKYALPEETKVELVIYNTLGQKVRTLVNGKQKAGIHKIVWNGKNDKGEKVASGVYFYKIKAGKFEDSKQMIMLK